MGQGVKDGDSKEMFEYFHLDVILQLEIKTYILSRITAASRAGEF
jgi:hypothetical protein